MVVERMGLDETDAQVEAPARWCRELHEPAQRDACAMLVGAPRTRWPKDESCGGAHGRRQIAPLQLWHVDREIEPHGVVIACHVEELGARGARNDRRGIGRLEKIGQ